ncbi:MAG: Integrase [Candidatus Gallionella acididurans]|uniref:Integrase n=1 Tax=Candidatus Gallionella acididurans TaxID=1796491 RepID=A0A139BPJ7_9PROT|nr:MAG: Integrase [Candidatus Gallionella acididurans]
MATFEQRASGWWQAKIRRKGQSVQSQTFEKKIDAETWARDIENKMDRGVFTDRSEAEATTLLEALNRYEREVSVLKDGHEQEKYRIGIWRADPLARRSLANLRSADFAKWRDTRLKQSAASTVRKDLAIISHLFTIATKEWGLAVTNPIKNLTLPKEDNARERRLEGDEEIRLVVALADSGAGKRSNHWMKPLVEFAIETAARQSELLALKWVDVDLTKAVTRIRGQERADGKSRTKNGDKFRDVPLSSKARIVLSTMPRSMGGYVFPTTVSAVKQAFVRACERACIEDFHFHDLRHEATTRLAEKLALHELMKVTGHKDTRMLSRYYHPRAEDLAKKLG